MHKKTAVIVISYNFWHDTVECLESLLRNDYPDYFVIVYDNGSTDGAPDHIRAWAEGKETPERTGGALERLVFPFLKKPLPYAVLDNSGKVLRQSGKNPILYLVEGGSNLGFPGGNNVAIRIALDMKAEIITLLNNDTVVEPGFLTPLADFLGHDDKTGSAGAAGGTICYYSRPEKIWAAGGGKLHWLTAGSAHYGMDFSPSNLPAGPVRLGYITGCLIALTAEAINRAGLMDDKYFLYYDETDWAVRLRDEGFSFYYIPVSKIYHKVSLTTENDSKINVKYYFTRNQIYFIMKNYSGFKKFVSLAVVLAIDLVRIANQLILKRNARKANVLRTAVLHGLTGRMGQFTL